MFLEDKNYGPWMDRDPAPPPRPAPLGKRDVTRLLWMTGINLVLLLIAPIGGATIIGALLALLKG